MESSPWPEAQRVERRSVPRTKVLLAATLERRGASTPVRLSDLSEKGSAIVGDVPEKHCTVTLRRDGVAVRSRVAWTSEGRGGLDFEETIDRSRMLEPVAPPRAPFTLPCRRPGLTSSPLCPAERQQVERLADLLGIAPSQRG